MHIGIEYVVSAYGIWACTFVIFIFLTKRRLKLTNKIVFELEQRYSGLQEKCVYAEDNENSN